MSNYVNKVLDKDQNEYPLRDERLPDAAPEDSGKVPVVNAEGNYELGLPASGTKLYKHTVTLSDNSKVYIISTAVEPMSSFNSLCSLISDSLHSEFYLASEHGSIGHYKVYAAKYFGGPSSKAWIFYYNIEYTYGDANPTITSVPLDIASLGSISSDVVTPL